VIGSDSHGYAVFLAAQNQGPESIRHPGQLVGIFAIRIFSNLEFFLVRVIARIDPNFFDMLGGNHGGVGREMDVGNKRNIETPPSKHRLDITQVLGIANRGGCHSRDLAPGGDHAFDLVHGGRGIHGIGIRHGLKTDGVIAAHIYMADANDSGRASATHPGVYKKGLGHRHFRLEATQPTPHRE
jgi:hypothetical protein